MLTSITPLGERSRGNRYAVTLTAYVLGCLLGGATTGAVLGLVGSALPTLPVLVLAGEACLAAARGGREPAPADRAPARSTRTG
jgi:hypothetical protein